MPWREIMIGEHYMQFAPAIPALFLFNASLPIVFGFSFAPLLMTFLVRVPWNRVASSLAACVGMQTTNGGVA